MFIKAKADYEEECNDTNTFQIQANFLFLNSKNKWKRSDSRGHVDVLQGFLE